MSDSPDSNRVVKICDDCGKPKYATDGEGCTCDESEESGESVQDSLPDLDMPTAAEFVDTGKDSNLPAVDPKNWILGEWKDGDELVRRGDAEEAVKDREEQVRQRILDKIGEDHDFYLRQILECPDCSSDQDRIFETSIAVCNDHVKMRERLVENHNIIEEIEELRDELEVSESDRSADSSGDLQNGEEVDA